MKGIRDQRQLNDARRWVDFVKHKHATWEPPSMSCICSKRFEPDAFVCKVNLPGQETYIPWLKKDEFGVLSFPTLFTANEGDEETTKRTARALRCKVRLIPYNYHKIFLLITAKTFLDYEIRTCQYFRRATNLYFNRVRRN